MDEATFIKDPDAILDYGVDWSNWLTDNETISSSDWDVPSGISKDSDSFSDTKTTIWLSGGTSGEEYRLINHIVTSQSRENDQTIKIRIREQ